MKILDCINKALYLKFTDELEAIAALKTASYEDRVSAWDLAIKYNSCFTTPKHLPFSQQKLAPNAKAFTDAVRGR